MLLLTLPQVYEVARSCIADAKPRYSTRDIAQVLNEHTFVISKALADIAREKHKKLRLRKTVDLDNPPCQLWWLELVEHHPEVEHRPEIERVEFVIFALARNHISAAELLRHLKAAALCNLLRQWKPRSVELDTRRENVADVILVRKDGAALYRFFLCDGEVTIGEENKSIRLRAAIS
jgi:hypothetical protein